MFKCKVCPEKDKRIQDLKVQIDFYQRMLKPSPSLPAVHIEANRIMDGANEQILDVSEANADLDKELSALDAEYNMIISGNY